LKCSDAGLHSNSASGAHNSILHVSAGKVLVPVGPATAAGLDKQRQEPRRSTSSSGSASIAAQHAQDQQQQQQQQHVVDVASLRDAPVPVHVADALADSVAAGMQRWRTAVSNTTMLLMERRMDAANLNLGSIRSAGGWSTGSGRAPAGASSSEACSREPSDQQMQQQQQQLGSSYILSKEQQQQAEQQSSQQLQAQASGAFGQFGLLGSTPPQLQLQDMLGQGSCGCVYLATWRGKRVAVKVMHLPANALLGSQGAELAANANQVSEKPGDSGDPELVRQRRRARVMQQNSAPHMAIMEAVLSSAMSHPNVVQVCAVCMCSWFGC
jgi:hypothetical protein